MEQKQHSINVPYSPRFEAGIFPILKPTGDWQPDDKVRLNFDEEPPIDLKVIGRIPFDDLYQVPGWILQLVSEENDYDQTRERLFAYWYKKRSTIFIRFSLYLMSRNHAPTEKPGQ